MKKLDKIFHRSEAVIIDEHTKLIIMSDCHRGQGNTGDNYLPNQTLHLAALKYYLKNGFSYIELGDGDELWENRNMYPILVAHSETFELLKQFQSDNRLYMLYGNHDIVKQRKSFKSTACCVVRHCIDCCEKQLFPDTDIKESLILQDKHTGHEIFLLHGHQCSLLNDTLWPIARFLVRYLWKPMELVGFCAPTGAARDYRKKEKLEQKLSNYANSRNVMVIAGHTHRPMYPAPGQGLYFNDGSCVHPEAITGLEIERGEISLVQWSVTAGADMTLYVHRKILEGPERISDFYSMP